MIYLLRYEPSVFLRNTEPLINRIKAFPGWAQCFDKTWLIATHDDIATVNEALSHHLTDNSDTWLLIPIGDYDGKLPQEIWDWINNSRNSGF